MPASGVEPADAAVMACGPGRRRAARTTLARRTSAVKTFTAWATRRGLLADDPAARLQVPGSADSSVGAASGPGAGGDGGASLGAEQCDPLALRDRLIVEMLYATGIRVSELCGLDIDDVDTARRLLRVLGRATSSARSRSASPRTPPWMPGCPRADLPWPPPAPVRLYCWARAGVVSTPARPARWCTRRSGRYPAPGHRSARPAAQRGHPPTRRRRRSARGAGTAGPLDAGHHAALHPRHSGQAAGGARPSPPASLRSVQWRAGSPVA